MDKVGTGEKERNSENENKGNTPKLIYKKIGLVARGTTYVFIFSR